MSECTEILLLVSGCDLTQILLGETETNIQKFNDWLKEMYPATRDRHAPQFVKETYCSGVFSIRYSFMNVESLVEKFRSIRWFEPDISQLRIIEGPQRDCVIYPAIE